MSLAQVWEVRDERVCGVGGKAPCSAGPLLQDLGICMPHWPSDFDLPFKCPLTPLLWEWLTHMVLAAHLKAHKLSLPTPSDTTPQ